MLFPLTTGGRCVRCGSSAMALVSLGNPLRRSPFKLDSSGRARRRSLGGAGPGRGRFGDERRRGHKFT
eukprot:28412-Hanusia_phi.AAC.6